MANDYGEDLLHTFNAMMSATEPRVVALVPAAFLEAHLQALILKKLPFLRSSLQDKLFGSDGALSSLGTKIDIAEALGAISQDLARRAVLIARVRNKFAHRIDVRDFDHVDVLRISNKFKDTDKAMPPRVFWDGEWRAMTKDNSEGRFIAAASAVCSAVAAELFGGEFVIKIESPDRPGTFQSISVRRSQPGTKAPDQADQ